jgi:hypothetical protein
VSDELAAFLAARLDDKADDAWDRHEGSCATAGPISFPCDCGYPARVLREVEAGRKILAAYEADDGPSLSGLYHAVAALAAVDSDHPGYREDFRP